MFEHTTIIGCGLIGSSILRAINKKKLSKKISIYDKSKEVSLFLEKENLKVNVANTVNAQTIGIHAYSRTSKRIQRNIIINKRLYKKKFNFKISK